MGMSEPLKTACNTIVNRFTSGAGDSAKSSMIQPDNWPERYAQSDATKESYLDRCHLVTNKEVTTGLHDFSEAP